MRGLVCLLLCVMGGMSFAQTGTIQGRVLDSKTEEPLPFTNIFVNNTTIGTSADELGYFKLANVPVGSNEIVFSFVGYQSLRTKISLVENQVMTSNVRLAPDDEVLESVVVQGKRDKEWEGQLNQFTKTFLGKHNSPDDARIVNPEVLEFREVGPILFATASDAIRIENDKLGYTLFYFLEKFNSMKGEDYTMVGNIRFEEMKTHEPKMASQWMENRWKAYQGSLRHLLSSILASKLKENGFELYNDKAGFENSARTSFFDRELGRSIERYDTSRLAIGPDSSGQNLQIFLHRHKIEVHNRSVSSKVRSYDDVVHQVSWLEIKNGSVRLSASGRVIDPESVVASGYMSSLRIGDQLPDNYQPVVQGTRAPAGKMREVYEKTYVQTDKPYYYPGERIWFKAYLNRYATPAATSTSNTLYVELLNPDGKIMLEKMIRIDSGYAAADLDLPNTVVPGNYFLRSYTNLQRNFGDENLMVKTLPIFKLTTKPTYTNESENRDDKFLKVTADKTFYSKHGKITLSLELKDEDGNPMAGNLSISVTDASQVIKIPESGSIVEKFPIRQEDIGKGGTLKFPAESGFGLRGQFLNSKGKGEKTDLNFIRFHPSEFFVVETDKRGNFTIQDLQFEGETELAMNSVKGPLAGKVKLSPRDTPPFTAPALPYDIQTVEEQTVQRILTGYNKPQDSKMLEEITVRGEVDDGFRKKPIETNNHAYGEVGQYVFGEDRIKTQFPNLLYTLQALNISGLLVNPNENAVYFARHAKPLLGSGGEEVAKSYSPMVTLDGVPMLGSAGDALRVIDPNTVGSIEVTKSQSTIRGSLAPYGVIAVFSKRGAKTDRSDFSSANFIKVNGYAVANEFRHPDYGRDAAGAEPDYRSTLYWNPAIKLSGSTGTAQLSFYASDLSGTYRVVVEGVTGQGDPVRTVSFVTVK